MFDFKFYLFLYPDLYDRGINTKIKAIEHWNKKGKFEKKIGFDKDNLMKFWKKYIYFNPYLIKKGITDKRSIIKHWYNVGKKHNLLLNNLDSPNIIVFEKNKCKTDKLLLDTNTVFGLEEYKLNLEISKNIKFIQIESQSNKQENEISLANNKLNLNNHSSTQSFKKEEKLKQDQSQLKKLKTLRKETQKIQQKETQKINIKLENKIKEIQQTLKNTQNNEEKKQNEFGISEPRVIIYYRVSINLILYLFSYYSKINSNNYVLYLILIQPIYFI